VKMLHVLKKKKEGMKFARCWERLFQKKERKEITIFYSAKSDVWPHPYQPWTNSYVALINLESVW
jgi:hypothetical protein